MFQNLRRICMKKARSVRRWPKTLEQTQLLVDAYRAWYDGYVKDFPPPRRHRRKYRPWQPKGDEK
jgi:hypothetical protein